MKKSNKKYLIALLIVFILALAIGYAAFTDALKIIGTGTANGTFSVIFEEDSTETKSFGCDIKKFEISEDGKRLDVQVDFDYPGAKADFTVNVKNNGTVPAKVSEVKVKEMSGNTNIIKITGLEENEIYDETLEKDGKAPLTFSIEWDKEYDESKDESENKNMKYCYFSFEIDYAQADLPVASE